MTKQEFVFCTNCGAKNPSNAKYCTNCGHPLVSLADSNQATSDQDDSNKTIISATTSRINRWTGGNGAVKVSLRDFFGQVFKHHTKVEAEEIFIVGTPETTPSLDQLVNDRVQPWLFSRALLFTFGLSILLWLLAMLNPRIGVLVSLDAVTSIAVPISALILFFEINVYKNISFYQIVQILLFGGVLSLILTMIIDIFLASNGQFDLIGALTTGVAEEVAKVLVAAYFIYRLNVKRIFNGMLIGAAIGSGFAAFENIMYMVNDQTGQLASIGSALYRTLWSISDHTEWCAISAAALVLAMKGQEFELGDLLKPTFLKFLISVILIHALWDWEFTDLNIVHVALAIITWLFVFVLIHAGLREVKELQMQIKQDKLTE